VATAAVLIGRHTITVNSWKSIAEQNGMTFQAKGWLNGNYQLNGQYRGRTIDAHIKAIRHSDSTENFTVIGMTLNRPVSGRYNLSNQGVGALVQKAVGKEDSKVGDDRLDRLFRIESEPDDLVQRVFGTNDALRQRVAAMHGLGHELGMGTSLLRLQVAGVVRRRERLETLLETLSLLAEATEAVA
jgi:hypothetical protein